MKKGFGILFIVVGALNFFLAIATFAVAPEYAHKAGPKLFMSIGFLILGIWMVSSAKSKKEQKANSSLLKNVEKDIPPNKL